MNDVSALAVLPDLICNDTNEYRYIHIYNIIYLLKYSL